MANEIMRSVSDALLLPTEGSGLSPRDKRELQSAVGRQAAGGIVRAAGVQADGFVANTVLDVGDFVTDTGLSRTARLSRHEEDAIREAPLGEGRYRAIVDAYAGLVITEIANLRGQR